MWQKGEQDFVGGGGSAEETITVYYLQAPWSPAKNVFIIPEFAVIDYGDWE